MTENNKSNIQKLTLLSLYAVIALAIYGFESMLPAPFPIPGIKLGLANIVSLIVLRFHGGRDALIVLIVRVLLSALLFGQLISLMYSLAGGLLCLLTMLIINRLLAGHFIFITSIAGAIFHNIGQLALAALILRSLYVLTYAPYLLVSGILTGLFTGLIAHFISPYLSRILRRFRGS